MRLLNLYLALALAALPAYGIGRSGNGAFNDDRDGYEMTTIPSFNSSVRAGVRRIRLETAIVATPEATKLFVEVSGAQEGLPELAKLSRRDLLPRMEKLGWIRVKHDDPCVEAFRQSVDTGDKLALFWGGQKGVVAIGPKSGNVALALEEIRAKLKLKAGACAW